MSGADPEHKPISQAAPPLVFAAVALGGLGIGFGIAATILMVRSQKASSIPSASASAQVARPVASIPPGPRGPWVEELHADSCAAPCCGGDACQVSDDNAGKASCKQGSPHCERCTSGISCIPGNCAAEVQRDEKLELHLSALAERGPGGEALDVCKTQRDLWLCLRTRDDKEWQCLSQREACSNDSRSPAGVSLNGEDLTRTGVDFEVREGSPEGTVLAHKDRALYRGALSRRGLCGGFRMSVDAPTVSSFTFFLDAVSPGGAAQPLRVPYQAAAEDAGAPGVTEPANTAASAPVVPSAAAPTQP